MEKAQKAKADTEKADELSTIKLAVVDSVAMGSDGRVSKANLVTALRKIPEVVASSDVDDLESSDNLAGPWTIIGKKASYEVAISGNVTKLDALIIAGNLTIKEGAVKEITVTKQGSATTKTVSWSKTGNVTFVTDSTGETEVSGQAPTTDTVYLKAGAYSSEDASLNSASVTVSAMGEDSKSCNITIKSSEFILGEPAENSAINYGKKVIDYKSNAETTQDEIGWRVFYQDTEENTYLIADKLVGSYNITGSMENYTGANISLEGKGLNPLIKDLFISQSSNDNMRATSKFTAPSLWSTYTDSNSNKKATFAIASPTIELYVKSYNAVATINSSVNEISYPTVGTYGYLIWQNGLTTEVNGIYAKSNQSWWLASPHYDGARSTLYVSQTCFYNSKSGNNTNAIRPIVCIPTSEIRKTYHLES